MAQQKPNPPALPITLTACPNSPGQPAGNSYQIMLHITLEPEDWIYHDYITLSSDSPLVSLTPWQATPEPGARYINSFKETKRVYMGSFTITSVATISGPTLGNLHLTYYKKSDKKITHQLIPLILSDQEAAGTALVQMGETSPLSCNANTKTGSSPNSLTSKSQVEHNTQAQEDHTQETTHCLPSTHYMSRAHTLFSHTAHQASHYTKQYATQYKAEIHTFVIILLILLLSLLKQKRRIACAAQNIALFILLWCYYALAGTAIPSYCYWLVTAILSLCVGILSIKKAEDIGSSALVSKPVYCYMYYFLIITGMAMVASSLILYAKAAQAYYIINAAF